MKLLHTSDWHLGHYLHGHDRIYEHEAFLSWLRATCREREVDALIVAGDIFDAANPPATAQAMYYRFLADLRDDCPDLDIVIVGGNHDSAMRLDAPRPLLQALQVQVVGGLPRDGKAHLDCERLCVPLTDRSGVVKAWCGAMPYLRIADLPRLQREDGDPLVDGTRAVYGQILEHMRAVRQPDQAMIATGHCYLAGTQLSELSERKIQRGNQNALPSDLFPEDIAYVALGHLHRPQQVGQREGIRYSGSPIPLSMAEQHYKHQVVLVALAGSKLANLETIPVPRTVPLMRLPGPDQALPWEKLKPLLKKLDDCDLHSDPQTMPYLEVQVLLEKPEPGLRHKVAQALTDKAVRLVKLSIHYAGKGGDLADAVPEEDLQNLDPQHVFERKYQAAFGTEETPEVFRQAFAELLDQVQNGSTA